LLIKAWFSTLVVLPVVAIAVARLLGVSRAAEIGILLMAICPGAPLALRRSLDARGDAAFSTVLQISLSCVAVVVIPLWIALLNFVYAGQASMTPEHVARQVLLVQLLPLIAGMAVRSWLPQHAGRIEPAMNRLSSVLLVVFLVLALTGVWRHLVDAGPRVVTAIVLITLLALTIGHALGGPNPATRTAVAISTGVRNAGLALLVAAANHAAPEIVITILLYLVFSALTLLPYATWRRRSRLVPGAVH
jgi:predicted Na+-dependent transporter